MPEPKWIATTHFIMRIVTVCSLSEPVHFFKSVEQHAVDSLPVLSPKARLQQYCGGFLQFSFHMISYSALYFQSRLFQPPPPLVGRLLSDERRKLLLRHVPSWSLFYHSVG